VSFGTYELPAFIANFFMIVHTRDKILLNFIYIHQTKSKRIIIIIIICFNQMSRKTCGLETIIRCIRTIYYCYKHKQGWWSITMFVYVLTATIKHTGNFVQTNRVNHLGTCAHTQALKRVLLSIRTDLRVHVLHTSGVKFLR